jgi:hypothetical protein
MTIRGLLLVVVAVILLASISPVPIVPIAPPPVTCSLDEERCPDIFWFPQIQWTNDIPFITSVEFRELPGSWGTVFPFEPEWAALVGVLFEPTEAAACHSDAGRVVCT